MIVELMAGTILVGLFVLGVKYIDFVPRHFIPAEGVVCLFFVLFQLIIREVGKWMVSPVFGTLRAIRQINLDPIPRSKKEKTESGTGMLGIFLKDTYSEKNGLLRFGKILIVFIILSGSAFALPGEVFGQPSNLVITRVCDGCDANGAEWVEVFNPTGGDLTITDLDEGANGNRWNGSQTLASGEYLLFHDGTPANTTGDIAVNLTPGTDEGFRITQTNGDTDAAGWGAAQDGFFEGSPVTDGTDVADENLLQRKMDSNFVPIDTDDNTNDFLTVHTKSGYRPDGASGLLISGVCDGCDANGAEWVEVFNPTGGDLTITDLDEGANGNRWNGSQTLASGEYLLFHDGTPANATGDIAVNLTPGTDEGFRITQTNGDTDAVGWEAAQDGFFEGSPVTDGTDVADENLLQRVSNSSGVPQDTDNNPSDFLTAPTKEYYLASGTSNPSVTIDIPNDNHDTNASPIDVRGTVSSAVEPGDSIVVALNDQPEDTVSVQSDSSWVASGVDLEGIGDSLVANLKTTGPGSSTTAQDTVTVNYDTQIGPSVSNLSVSDQGQNSITLNWDAVTASDETGFSNYTIYYSQSSPVLKSTANVWSAEDDSNLSDSSTTSTELSGLNLGTTYYFKIAWEDNATNESPLSSEVSTSTESAPEPPLIKDWDATKPTWGFTNDVAFFDNGWGSDGRYDTVPETTWSGDLNFVNLDSKILGVNDLDDEGENGTDGEARVTFDKVDVSQSESVQITFNYDAEGLDSGDYLKYELFEDGTGQGPVTVAENETSQGTTTINVSDSADLVYFELIFQQNGASDYIGVDNVKISGNVSTSIGINNPADGTNTSDSPIQVDGTVSGADVGDSVVVAVNGQASETTTIKSDSSWVASSVGLQGMDDTLRADLYSASTSSSVVAQDSVTVNYDNTAGTHPSNFNVTGVTSSEISLGWDSYSSDPDTGVGFSNYSIFYRQANSVSSDDNEWNEADDSNLSDLGTNSTTIGSLNSGETYALTIGYRDLLGNLGDTSPTRVLQTVLLSITEWNIQASDEDRFDTNPPIQTEPSPPSPADTVYFQNRSDPLNLDVNVKWQDVTGSDTLSGSNNFDDSPTDYVSSDRSGTISYTVESSITESDTQATFTLTNQNGETTARILNFVRDLQAPRGLISTIRENSPYVEVSGSDTVYFSGAFSGDTDVSLKVDDLSDSARIKDVQFEYDGSVDTYSAQFPVVHQVSLESDSPSQPLTMRPSDRLSNRSTADTVQFVKDRTAGDAPSNLSVSDTSFESVQLDWSAFSNDPDTESGFGAYRIYYSQSQPVTRSDSVWTSRQSPNLNDMGTGNTTVNELQPNTTYYISLAYRDRVRNVGDISTSIEVTTATSDLNNAIVINEALPDPESDWNGDGSSSDDTDEFVELYNMSPDTIDVGGAQIDDEQGVNTPNPFPNAVQVPPRGYVTVWRTNDFFVQDSTGDSIQSGTMDGSFNALNNSGDTVRLLTSGGAVLDQTGYTNPNSDRTISRQIDGWDNFVTDGSNNPDGEPTPGVAYDLSGDKAGPENGRISLTVPSVVNSDSEFTITIDVLNSKGNTFNTFDEMIDLSTDNSSIDPNSVNLTDGSASNKFTISPSGKNVITASYSTTTRGTAAVDVLDATVRGGLGLADGSDTAPLVVSLGGVPNLSGYSVNVSFKSPTPSLNTTSVTTGDSGQARFSATSSVVDEYTATAKVNGSPIRDTATVQFTGTTDVNFAVGGVDEVQSVDQTGSDTVFLQNALLAPDGSQVAYWGLFRGERPCSRKVSPDLYCADIYINSRTGGSETKLTSDVFQADPLNQLSWGKLDVNDDGVDEEVVLFSNVDWSQTKSSSEGRPYFRHRAQPFAVPTDGSASRAGRGNLPTYSLSPGDTGTQYHYLDYFGGNDQILASKGGNLVVWDGSCAAKNTPSEYDANCSAPSEVVSIFSSTGDPSWYVTEPRWSENGNKIAFARYDIRDFIYPKERMSTEIWVLKNAQSYVGSPVTSSSNSDLVKIDGNIAQDGATYLTPDWNRSNDVVSYAKDLDNSFDINDLRDQGPNQAFRNGQFDQLMKYVPKADGPADTFVENSFNEWSLNWNFGDISNAYAVSLERYDGSMRLRSYEITDQTTVRNNGGILFDNGKFIAQIAPGDTKAEGTTLEVEDPESTPSTQTDTLIKTGNAREFHHSGEGFSRDVTVKFHYTQQDLDQAGLDGSNEEQLLTTFWYNSDKSKWEEVGGRVDPDNNTITFQTDHFSIYELGVKKNVGETSTLEVVDRVGEVSGSDTVHLKATIVDTAGDPLPNIDVGLQYESGGVVDTFVSEPEKTRSDGTMDLYVRGNQAGTATISFDMGDDLKDDTQTVRFVEDTGRDTAGGRIFSLSDRTAILVPDAAFDTLPDGAVLQTRDELPDARQESLAEAQNESEAEREFRYLREATSGTAPVRSVQLFRGLEEISENKDLEPDTDLTVFLSYDTSVADDSGNMGILRLNEASNSWVWEGQYEVYDGRVSGKVSDLSVWSLGFRRMGQKTDRGTVYESSEGTELFVPNSAFDTPPTGALIKDRSEFTETLKQTVTKADSESPRTRAFRLFREQVDDTAPAQLFRLFRGNEQIATKENPPDTSVGLRVSLPYDTDVHDSVARNLGLLRLNASSPEWKWYGGSADPNKQVVAGTVPYLSTWTLGFRYKGRKTDEGIVYETMDGTRLTVPDAAYSTMPDGAVIDSKEMLTESDYKKLNNANDALRGSSKITTLQQALETSAPVRRLKLYRGGHTLDTPPEVPLTLEIPYDTGIAGVESQNFGLMVLDEEEENWEWIGSETDFNRQIVSSQVPHLSIWAVGIGSAVSSLDDVRVYPNPWTPDVHTASENPGSEKFGVKFQVPQSRFQLIIYDELGQKVDQKTVNTTGTSPVIRWDLRNKHGRKVASGVYLYVLRDLDSGDHTKGKFAIVK